MDGRLVLAWVVCVCREPIVPHDIVYGVQFFYVFFMLWMVGVQSVV